MMPDPATPEFNSRRITKGGYTSRSNPVKPSLNAAKTSNFFIRPSSESKLGQQGNAVSAPCNHGDGSLILHLILHQRSCVRNGRKLLAILIRQLHRLQSECDLVDLAGELERCT